MSSLCSSCSRNINIAVYNFVIEPMGNLVDAVMGTLNCRFAKPYGFEKVTSDPLPIKILPSNCPF